MHVFFRQCRSDAARRGGGDGAHIHDDMARFGAVNQAVFAEDDLFDIGCVGDHREGDIACGSNFGGRTFAQCTRDQHGFETVETPTINNEFMPRAHQIFGHRASHDAAANKAYIHIASPFDLCRVSYFSSHRTTA